MSPMLLTNYGRVLRDLGRAREALDYAQRGYSKAQQAGYSSVMNQSLALQVSIYRILGDYKRAADILSDAEARFKRELPAGHIFFAALTSERAQLARARGDMQAAIENANQAVALAEASIKGGRQGSDLLPRLLVRLSSRGKARPAPPRRSGDGCCPSTKSPARCCTPRYGLEQSSPRSGILMDSALGTNNRENVPRRSKCRTRRNTIPGLRREPEGRLSSPRNCRLGLPGSGRWSSKRKVSVILELLRGADLGKHIA